MVRGQVPDHRQHPAVGAVLILGEGDGQSFTSKIGSISIPPIRGHWPDPAAAQLVAQQGEKQHHSHQGQTGEHRQPPLASGEIAHALRQDDPDGGLLRRQAEAQEGDAGLVEDGVVGKSSTSPVRNWGSRWGIIWRRRMAPGTGPACRHQYVGGALDLEHLAPHHPGQRGPVAEGHTRHHAGKALAEGQRDEHDQQDVGECP